MNGAPAGFFELNKASDEVTELSYFGLLEEAIGAGVGSGSSCRRFMPPGRTIRSG